MVYGEHQPVFNGYPQVHLEDGLPQLNDEVFDGREPTMIVVDDHMFDVNQLFADILTKISHHRNISILYLTQNLFNKNRYARTISLNAHYLILFKNRRDAEQFAIFARQMYPTCWKFAAEGYEDATNMPYGYLLVDLKPDQDERYRLRTNVFPERCSTCMFASKGIDMLGRQWMAIYVNNNIPGTLRKMA